MTAATAATDRAREKVPATRSTMWLIGTSIVSTLLCLGAGLPSLVLGVLALTKNSTNHPLAKKLTTLGWWVFTACLALVIVGVLGFLSTTEAITEFWDSESAAEVLPLLLEKFVKATLLITVVGSTIAALLGLVCAVLTTVLPRPLAGLLRFAMDFVRMTPLVVQLVFVGAIVSGGWNDHLLWVGTVVIGIHYSTYMAESYIAGIASVDPGQWEAATALSLPRGRTWTGVVLPQAIRATLPSLGNWTIAMFKDTPFLFAISVVEMVTAAQQYGANTFRYNEAMTIAGLIFLVASLFTALAVRKMEKSLAY